VNHVSEAMVLALGAAVSPIPLTVSILLLSQPDRGRAKALAFAAGQVLALAILSVIFAVVLRKTLGTAHPHAKHSATLDIVLGALLLLLAARKLLTKPKAKKEKPHKQRSLFAEFAFGAGLMAVNVETLLLVLASVKALVGSKIGVGAEALGLLAIVLIVTVSATLPPLITFVIPKQSEKALKWLNKETTKHQRGIAVGFLIFFGVYLLYKGLSG
jgi:threonine/homoserine/homoserine lactone efflux protein